MCAARAWGTPRCGHLTRRPSYDHLKWLKAYAEARLDTSAFGQELEMVDEMLQLLPGKLDRLSAGYAL